MTFLEANLDGLVAIIFMVMFGPPIVLALIGVIVKSKSPKAAKVLFILAGLYMLIGLGICGSMMI
ncbi:hypothetical protein MG290_08655 [Flavobacterium sp. CBA20B-1]|uniref:hypothetical protein n=1 Tax=unclassified Flavobacterium TaxID=196869 RepID=UPI0022247CDF|nr:MULTISPECIES: hypothetical protein [unclassified Flavobacterium]WCM41029.1 hypothetical protein MG290_08655 [Flavobacterium sp. CBA20B-1]